MSRPDATREMASETLNQTCATCGLKRLEHSGTRFVGACPGSRYGDGRKFRNANPEPRKPGGNRLLLKPLPGGGPWRILAECPSQTHNTARAGEGRKRDAEGAIIRCICPRALHIKEERLKAWQATRRGSDADALRMRSKDIRPEPVEKRAPDLSKGNCQRPANRVAVDGGFDQLASPGSVRRREAAKAVCSACPLLTECREYTLSEERPVGSWGGVWGGMDPWNRRGQQMTLSPGGQVRLVPYVVR